MMNVAYLILAHDNPSQLCRLITALSEEWTRFYVHIDRKSPFGAFNGVAGLSRTEMARRRLPICWGGYSMVQATLDLMSQAMSSGDSPDWYILMSGADYPMRANAEIQAFLSASTAEHICCYAMPGPNDRKSLSRLETFWFEGALGQWKAQRVILHQANRLLAGWKRDYRSVLGQMTPYAGGQWWALSRAAVAYILDFVKSQVRFVQFYKHVLIPDEMFFQTILGNSHFQPKIARNLIYADWAQGITRHPAALTDAHVNRFADPNFQIDDEEGKGPCFFARKFIDPDGKLRDRMDEIRNAENAAMRAQLHKRQS